MTQAKETQDKPEGEKKDEKSVHIIINSKPFSFDKSVLEPSDFRGKVKAPDEYEVWMIVKDADPEGTLPVDDIQVTGPVTVKSGERFRVVPPGTFGAR